MGAFLFALSPRQASFGAVLSLILVPYLYRKQLANPPTPRVYTEILDNVEYGIRQDNHIRRNENAKQALSSSLPTSETESFIEELGEAIEDLGENLLDSNAPAVDVAELVFQRKLRNQANKKPKRRRL